MPAQAKRRIKFIDPFKQDFGKVSADKREQIVAVLRRFMRNVRSMLEAKKRLMNGVPPEMKGMCESCAFEPTLEGTEAFPGTAYGLLRTVYEDRLFVCHSGQPDWREKGCLDPDRLKLCEGFRAARIFCGTELTVTAFKTVAEIEKIAPLKK